MHSNECKHLLSLIGMKIACFLLLGACIATLAAAKSDTSTAPANSQVVVLEPMKISGSPIISFAIDIAVYRDPSSKKVNRIFITKVWPGTDAESANLQVGDEIVKIDGVAVKEFDAVVSVESSLGKIFLNRVPGSPLRLEVLTRKTEKVILRAQQDTLADRLR